MQSIFPALVRLAGAARWVAAAECVWDSVCLSVSLCLLCVAASHCCGAGCCYWADITPDGRMRPAKCTQAALVESCFSDRPGRRLVTASERCTVPGGAADAAATVYVSCCCWCVQCARPVISHHRLRLPLTSSVSCIHCWAGASDDNGGDDDDDDWWNGIVRLLTWFR